MDTEELQWSSPEFHYVERNARWYLISIGLALILAIFAIFQKNYLFLLFVVIGELTVLFMSRQRPRLYGYEITDQGIVVDGTMVYLFSALKGFAIVDDGISGFVELVILPSKKLGQYIKILMPRKFTEAVFPVLSSRLSVIAYEEGLGEIIMKRFGL